MAGTLAAALVAAAGCGGDDAAPKDAPKPSKPTAAARADAQRPGSPSAVVKRFWGYVRDGAVPGALDMYSSRVVRSVGVGPFSGALASRQATVAGTKANVLNVERVRGGALVTFEGIPKVGDKTRQSFFVRRSGRRWVVVYDTLTAGAVQSYAQLRANPRGDNAPREAQRVLEDYLDAALR